MRFRAELMLVLVLVLVLLCGCGGADRVVETLNAEGALVKSVTYRGDVRHVVSRLYWSSGSVKLENHYVDGRLNGVEKTWYEDGQLFKQRTLVDGREEGLQRAWRRNGTLYTNYEMRNGRSYGLRRSVLCDSVAQSAN